jgi:penicillin amidase
MKKLLIRSAIALATLVLLCLGAAYFWLKSSLPVYSGEKKLAGLHEPVDAYFDEYGIPHIDAKNAEDAYRALGYLHAQERLFQLELLRRAGSGTLAEIIGEDMVKVDCIFRTLGVSEYAKTSAANFQKNHVNDEMSKEVNAYMEGVNQFIENGPTPPEFTLMGIPKRKLTVEDMFSISAAMSFSFQMANKTEPVMTHVALTHGKEYLYDLGMNHNESESEIKQFDNRSLDSSLTALNNLFLEAEQALPVTPFDGSNAWAVAGSKSATGKPIFCNDTHIGYALPQTWFEAHVKCPEFEITGHFLAGIPYALVGRTPNHAWGVTMLEHDEMDFYAEKRNPNNANEVWYKGQYVPLTFRKEEIKIKGKESLVLNVPITPHGPVVNEAFFGMNSSTPISISWVYTKVENKSFEAFREMNLANNMNEFEAALPQIHGPGLSVNYADNEGNIAWWACAHLAKRNPSCNSWVILNASDTTNEWNGYYSFKENPRCVNPSWGYIYSANDWPGAMADGSYYPGYYKPQYRADRICTLLEASDKWTAEKMKTVLNDITSTVDAGMLKELEPIAKKSKYYEDVAPAFIWDGAYEPETSGPVLFNRFLYYYLKFACEDEMGKEIFNLFLDTHQMQRTQLSLFQNENAVWWDNVNTKQIETREDILLLAFETAAQKLLKEEGVVEKWAWKNVCKLELKHPLGVIALFKPFLNREELPVYGGNETIHQSGFKLDSTGTYHVHFGSQMRIIHDFANNDSWNINPAGQSGHPLSKHYLDQAELYRTRQFRHEWNDWEKIKTFPKLRLS